MEGSQCLSFRWNTVPGAGLEGAHEGAVGCLPHETVGDVRARLAESCRSSRALAADHAVQLWLRNDDGTLRDGGLVKIYDFISELPLAVRNRPFAGFLLFTFPPAPVAIIPAVVAREREEHVQRLAHLERAQQVLDSANAMPDVLPSEIKQLVYESRMQDWAPEQLARFVRVVEKIRIERALADLARDPITNADALALLKAQLRELKKTTSSTASGGSTERSNTGPLNNEPIFPMDD